jgi:hypothetical protein
MTPEDIKIDAMMEEAIASSEIAEEELKLCHNCNTMKHIRNGTMCQRCMRCIARMSTGNDIVKLNVSENGTIKLFTQERLDEAYKKGFDDACTLYQQEPLK